MRDKPTPSLFTDDLCLPHSSSNDSAFLNLLPRSSRHQRLSPAQSTSTTHAHTVVSCSFFFVLSFSLYYLALCCLLAPLFSTRLHIALCTRRVGTQACIHVMLLSRPVLLHRGLHQGQTTASLPQLTCIFHSLRSAGQLLRVFSSLLRRQSPAQATSSTHTPTRYSLGLILSVTNNNTRQHPTTKIVSLLSSIQLSSLSHMSGATHLAIIFLFSHTLSTQHCPRRTRSDTGLHCLHSHRHCPSQF